MSNLLDEEADRIRELEAVVERRLAEAADRLRTLEERCRELEAIVERMPKNADGDPITLGSSQWAFVESGDWHDEIGGYVDVVEFTVTAMSRRGDHLREFFSGDVIVLAASPIDIEVGNLECYSSSRTATAAAIAEKWGKS